ncbi:hypothetical protein FXO37_03346 [Capsicum annuum]|nr:hypothetical protein FXO37_03346 [Capsicum annuum]
MAYHQNREFDLDENREIDLNKEFDMTEKIISLERENDLLLRKVDKLEGTHRVELKAKEREIDQRKKMLQELDIRWKNHKDLVCLMKDRLAEDQVNQLLRKIDKLEAKHRIELEVKEREIRDLKQMLQAKEELLERRVNEVLTKFSKSQNKLENHENALCQMLIESELVGGSSGVNMDN